MTDIQPVREGSRWRFAKPSSDAVGEWFRDVPLDGGMAHEDFVAGVVLIPQGEKVKKQVARDDGTLATVEQHELTWTPYVRVDTRVTYFRKLAADLGLIAVIEPVYVPQLKDGPARNDNMPPGFWWHIVPTTGESLVRFLCCTMRVALYDKEAWTGDPIELPDDDGVRQYVQRPLRALREGTATKQVKVAYSNGNVDENMLMKAETGAVGRALGMAGILVVGTGIATAEDMAEARESAPLELPQAEGPAETAEELDARLLRLQARLAAEQKEKWTEVAEWWKARSHAEGWAALTDAPIEVRRGMASRIERLLESPTSDPNSSSDAPDPAESVETVSQK